MGSKFRTVLIIILGFTLSDCERADEEDLNLSGNGEATLSNIQATIFNLNCAVPGCHSGSNPPQGMNLSEGEAFSNIVRGSKYGNVFSIQDKSWKPRRELSISENFGGSFNSWW